MSELKLTPVQEAKLMELWEKGSKDHIEHLCHMRGDKVLFESDGTENRAAFPDGYDERKIFPGDIVMHNHPTVLNSFSNADLYNGAYFKVHSYVITEDKSIYYARSLVDVDVLRLDWEIGNLLVGPMAEEAYAEQGVLHAESGSIHFATNDAHYINKWLARMGDIEYSHRLSAPTQAIVDKVDAFAKAKIAELKK